MSIYMYKTYLYNFYIYGIYKYMSHTYKLCNMYRYELCIKTHLINS